MKTKLFSVTKKSLVWEYYKGSGSGGQKRNKTTSAVRVKHPPSGAAECCEAHRERTKNRVEALRKLAKNERFLLWCRAQVGGIDAKVDAAMHPANIRVEYGRV